MEIGEWFTNQIQVHKNRQFNNDHDSTIKEVYKMTYWRDEFNNYRTRKFYKEYRQEIIKWLESLSPDAFLTLNFNCEMTLYHARKRYHNFLARLDRRLVGPRWLKLPDKRTDLIAFPENVNSNLHFHAIGKLPPKAYDMCQVTLMAEIDRLWKSVVRSGSTDFQFITYDKHVLPDYITKQIGRPGVMESFVSSREFWSRG